MVAAILELAVIEKILTHLGLQRGHRPARRPEAKCCRRLDTIQP